MKMAILELEYKNIRKITALKLPFTKADGSVISNNFIMMANGTGKTTTMELIKGLPTVSWALFSKIPSWNFRSLSTRLPARWISKNGRLLQISFLWYSIR